MDTRIQESTPQIQKPLVNDAQRGWLIFGAIVVVLMLAFPPWRFFDRPGPYAPIWTQSHLVTTVDWARLLLQVVGVGILEGVAWVLNRTK